MNKTYVLVVDDHPIVLAGMSYMLNQIAGVRLVEGCQDGLRAMEIIRNEPVEIVITDINLPQISGLELCRKIKSEYERIRVIGMSTFHDPEYVAELIRIGGSGFITKNASLSEIERAIESASKGEIYISPLLKDQQPLQFSRQNGPVLTRREREVLELIAKGLTNKDMAQQLMVSLNTVDSHRKNLMQKLDVANSASLIAKAGKLGLIE